MGVIDWIKTPEGAFLIGMPVGYVVVNWAKGQITTYIERTGEEIGRNIARGMGQRTSENGGCSDLDAGRIYKTLEDLSARLSEIEKKVGYRNE